MNPLTANTEPNETHKLRAALEKADKTLIIFGANLGEAVIANRGALAHNLNVGIRNSTISKSGADATVAAKNVRVVTDAMSLVKNAEFLGGSSKIQTLTLTLKLTDPDSIIFSFWKQYSVMLVNAGPLIH